jgi:hypothetical protein
MKAVGCTVNSAEYAFLPAFAKAAGWDLASSRIVQVDAISGFAISIAPVLVATNMKPHFMLYSAQGSKFYSNAMLP